MATTVDARLKNEVVTPPPAVQFKPVKLWAWLGVVCMGLTALSWGRWLLGGHAKPTPTGRDDVPSFMTIAAHIHEVVFFGGTMTLIYFLIVKPWRRDRRLGFDGMLLIAMVSAWALQDPLLNYGRIVFSYNSTFPNLGCPQCYLPGWQSTAQTNPEPLTWMPFFYAGFAMLAIFMACRIAKFIERTWPRAGRLGGIAGLLSFLFCFDLVTEVFWLRLGLYTYSNTMPWSWSVLFYGKFYQLPVIEVALASVWYLTPTLLRMSRNDKGLSWAELGIDTLRVSEKRRSGIRLLGIIGFVNVGFFLVYNLPFIVLSYHWNNFNPDDIHRSYLTNQMCGPGTRTACYDPRIPIPFGNSARVTPEGKFVAPEGLPNQSERESK